MYLKKNLVHIWGFGHNHKYSVYYDGGVKGKEQILLRWNNPQIAKQRSKLVVNKYFNTKYIFV